jgi:hypothetical protein
VFSETLGLNPVRIHVRHGVSFLQHSQQVYDHLTPNKPKLSSTIIQDIGKTVSRK